MSVPVFTNRVSIHALTMQYKLCEEKSCTLQVHNIKLHVLLEELLDILCDLSKALLRR